jgi:hypothetical protein
MKTIEQAMMEQIYLQADELAKGMKQTSGEKNDYYITLEQLQMIIDKFYE